MRTRRLFIGIIFTTFLATGAAHSQRCDYPTAADFVAEREQQDYVIRTIGSDRYGIVRKWTPLYGVGDRLAEEANAQAFYLFFGTWKDMPKGEWHGPDLLNALRALGQAAGFEVITAPPDWWLIGPAEYQRDAEIQITAHPVWPDQWSPIPNAEAAALERDLVRRLPVRDTEGAHGDTEIDVSYFWLREEGDDRLLVLSELGHRGAPACKYIHYKAFKLRVSRGPNGFTFDCLWESQEPHGRLLPEIAEDFDGDGVRDLVFDASGCDEVESSILSGADGRVLFEFGTNELAVEKKAAGPKKFAVQWSWAVDRGHYLPEVGRVSDLGAHAPLVLNFDPGARAFAVDVADGIRVRTLATDARADHDSSSGPRRWLSALLGSSDRVRVYLFAGGAHRPNSKVEEVPIRHVIWAPQPPSVRGLLPDHYQSTLVFEYKAPDPRKPGGDTATP
jgi:hypothetical protein